MARAYFGAGTSDWVFGVFEIAGRQLVDLEPATLTLWSAKTGGTQYTDLLLDGVAVNSIPVGADGQVPQFQGPDGITSVWADAGGLRVLMTNVESLVAQVLNVGSVLATENGDGTVTLTVAGGSAWTVVDNGDGTANVSLAGQTATLGQPPTVAREVAGGVAGLDASGKLYASRIPTTVQLSANLGADVRAVVKSREAAVYNVLDYGADPIGTTDSTSAIQGCFNAAATAAGTVKMPPGYYKTSAPLTLNAGIDARGARINTYGGGLFVGPAGGGAVLFAAHLDLPALTASGGDTIFGLVLRNLNTCEVYAPHVGGYTYGITCQGVAQGFAYNNVHLGSLSLNSRGLELQPGAGGWVNQNVFVGGRIDAPAYTGGARSGFNTAISLVQGDSSAPNNNTFIGTSVEGNINAQYRMMIEGNNNMWINCRWEAFGGDNIIRWGATAQRNVIDGGSYAETLTATAITGSANNKIVLPWL